MDILKCLVVPFRLVLVVSCRDVEGLYRLHAPAGPVVRCRHARDPTAWPAAPLRRQNTSFAEILTRARRGGEGAPLPGASGRPVRITPYPGRCTRPGADGRNGSAVERC